MAESAINTEGAREESASHCGCRSKRGTSAPEILDRRYVNGEITREQYEQVKQDLGRSIETKKGCC